jgi:hypothetical protein
MEDVVMKVGPREEMREGEEVWLRRAGKVPSACRGAW